MCKCVSDDRTVTEWSDLKKNVCRKIRNFLKERRRRKMKKKTRKRWIGFLRVEAGEKKIDEDGDRQKKRRTRKMKKKKRGGKNGLKNGEMTWVKKI